MKWRSLILGLLMIIFIGQISFLPAVEIPLDTITPVRIGYIDLQKVFDTYPEKAFAEGDLLKEIEKRKRELVRRQGLINALRQQIAQDQAAFDQARNGHPVVVPHDVVATEVPEEVPAPEPPRPPQPKTAVSTTTAVEPYPTDEPLAGLPGHGFVGSSTATATSPSAPASTVLVPHTVSQLLEQLAGTGTPTTLTPQAMGALDKRLTQNRKALDRMLYEFKDFRSKAVDDMKTLQTQKTYGVMARIYAILQQLARDESIMIVLDKAYVLYGEDTVDLTDKLIARLNQGETQ